MMAIIALIAAVCTNRIHVYGVAARATNPLYCISEYPLKIFMTGTSAFPHWLMALGYRRVNGRTNISSRIFRLHWT
jgi:hypothetical protein